MNFLKLYKHSILPIVNSANHCVCLAFEDADVSSYELKELPLGLILIHIPNNYVVQVIETNEHFKILTKFWLASSSALKLPIIAQVSFSIKTGDPLCRIQLLPIYVFLPGTLIHNFSFFSMTI